MADLPSTLFGPGDPALAPKAPDPTTGLSFADFINMLQRLVPTQGSDLNYSGEPWLGAPKQPSKRTRDKPNARPGDYLGRTEGKNARPISTPPAGIPRTSMPPGSTTRLVTPFAPAAQMPNDPAWMGGVPPTVAGVPGEPPMIPTPSSPYIPSMNTPAPGQSGPFSLPNTATPEAAVAGLGGDPAHPGMAVGPGFRPQPQRPKCRDADRPVRFILVWGRCRRRLR